MYTIINYLTQLNKPYSNAGSFLITFDRSIRELWDAFFVGTFAYYDVIFPGRNPEVNWWVSIDAAKQQLKSQVDSVNVTTTM